MKLPEEYLLIFFGALIGILIFCGGLWVGISLGNRLSRFDEGVAIGRIQQYEKLIETARIISKKGN